MTLENIKESRIYDNNEDFSGLNSNSDKSDSVLKLTKARVVLCIKKILVPDSLYPCTSPP